MEAMEIPRASTVSFRPGRRLARRWQLDSMAIPTFLTPALALYGLFVLWPGIEIFWLALQRWNGYGPRQFIGLANLGSLWGDQLFRTSLAHSVLWLVAALVIAPVAALILALAARNTPRGELVLSLLFFPVLLPATVVAALAILVYSPLTGFLNSALRILGLGRFAADWLGDPHLALGALFLAWVWSAVGVGTIILWMGIGSIGREYVELADTEGAGSWWRLWHVTLPGVQRSLFVVAVIDVALASQVFDLVFVTTGGGPGDATMLLPLDMYGRAFGGRAGEGAMVATVQVLLVLGTLFLLVPLWQRAPSLGTETPSHNIRSVNPIAGGFLLIATVLTLLPLAWLPVVALQPGRALALGGPDLVPKTLTFANIVDAWEAGVPAALLTSAGLAIAATSLTIVLIAPAAFAMARPFRRRTLVLGALLFGLLQPATVVLIPLFSLLKDLTLLNTMWGILLPEIARAIPFGVLVVWGYLAGLPEEILEAAAVDGASPLRQLLSIAVPLARPAFIAVAIWTFVSSWNEYLLPTVVSQDGSITTVPTVLASFVGTLDTRFGVLAAGSIIAMLPSILIYLTLRRSAATGLDGAGRHAR